MNFCDKQWDLSFTNLAELESEASFMNFPSEKSQFFENTKNFEGAKGEIVGILDEKPAKRIIGTPDYMSPEIIDGIFLKDPAIDWWSCGVILFEFLSGIPPFNAETPEKIFENIKGNIVPWEQINIGYEEGSITPGAKDLISKLLDPDYRKRLGRKGVKEIQQHRFFKGFSFEFSFDFH